VTELIAPEVAPTILPELRVLTKEGATCFQTPTTAGVVVALASQSNNFNK